MSAKCPRCGAALPPGLASCPSCGQPPDGEVASTGARSESSGPARKAVAPSAKRDKSRDLQLVGKLVAEKYKVLEVLGQGGFGTVYRVEITAGMVGEQLALKVLPEELSAQAAFREQFLNEIRVAMRLVDRQIVQIRDVGVTQDGLLYYTMDLCPGATLAQVLKQEGKLPITRALLIILNVLRGLQAAHGAGIVHRDLKPGNIMVDAGTGKDAVRVLDFGIATAIQSRERLKGIAGSPHYMPPEQFLGEPVGFYSDLYSVGVILYECITGRKPHPGATPQEIFKSLKTQSPPPAESLTPDVASFPGLPELLKKTLEKNPERRFQSARELFEALNAILQRGTGIAPAAAPSPPAAAAVVGAPAPRAAQERRATGAAGSVRLSPEHVRRHRRPRRSAGSNAAAVALATILIAGVVSAVVFHKEIGQWLASSPFGHPTDTAAPGAASREAAAPAKPGPADKAARAGGALSGKTPAPGPETKPASAAAREPTRVSSGAPPQRDVASLLDEAGKASERGEWAQVAAACSAALSLEPRNLAALELHGVAALKTGDAQKALDSFRGARQQLEDAGTAIPPALEARIAAALLGVEPPQASEAEAIVGRLLGTTPRDPELHILKLRALEAQRQDDKLAAAVAAARALERRSPELDALLARLQAAASQDKAAQARAALAESSAALEKGEWQPAAAHARRALDLDRSAGAAAALALAQLAAGQTGKARETLDAAKELADESPGGRRLAETRALLAGGAAEGAAEKLAPLTASKDPLIAGIAHLQLARLARLGSRGAADGQARKKSLGAARTRLQAALRQKTFPAPLRAESLLALGLLQLDLGDAEKNDAAYQQAIVSFSAAEEAGLKTVELYESWGKAHDRTGNLIRAAGRYRNAYDLQPSPAACLRAANSYLDANPSSPEAVDILRDGAARFPDDASIRKKHKELGGE